MEKEEKEEEGGKATGLFTIVMRLKQEEFLDIVVIVWLMADVMRGRESGIVRLTVSHVCN